MKREDYPEGIEKCLNILTQSIRESADARWDFRRVQSSKKLRLIVCDLIYPGKIILEHEIPTGTGFVYEGGLVFQINPDKIREFSDIFLTKIEGVEEQYSEKNRLQSAADALDTLLRREEFMSGPCDPLQFFRRRYARVKKVYEEHEDELSGFPIGVINKEDFFAPKEILERGKKMLEEAAEKRRGKDLFIRNMGWLTAGFRKMEENILLFDPIDWYYTEDKKSQRFKEQLRIYSRN